MEMEGSVAVAAVKHTRKHSSDLEEGMQTKPIGHIDSWSSSGPSLCHVTLLSREGGSRDGVA